MDTLRRKFFIRVGCALSLACLLCFGFNSPAVADSDGFIVKTMTRNMDAGTDLNLVTAATTGPGFILGVIQTAAEVDASNIPTRATRLAGEIAAEQPDLVALQEVTIWDITDAAGNRHYDQLDLLLTALQKQGMSYRVAALLPLTYIPVDLNPFGVPLAVEFTDQNAILIRSDVPLGHLDALGSETHVYEHRLPFQLPTGDTIDVLQGWMAVDVKVRGVRFKFANTHLLSPVPLPELFDYTAGIQSEQAQELIGALEESGLPIILAGDFNSDASSPQHGPDQTASASDISAAGYLDAWRYVHPSDAGYTWPLFLEDQLAGLDPSLFAERIDLLFSLGPKPLSIERTGLTSDQSGLYASDHAGVVATFDLNRH